MPDAIDLGFTLLPADDPASTPEADLADAEASALAPDFASASQEAPEPLGRSWLLDWDIGCFRRRGDSAVVVAGLDALAQWCQMALHSARFAHQVFSDDFGVEQPEEIIGQIPTPAIIRDFGRRIERALLVHDRIASVENFEAHVVDAGAAIELDSLDVITDEQDVLSLAGTILEIGDI